MKKQSTLGIIAAITFLLLASVACSSSSNEGVKVDATEVAGQPATAMIRRAFTISIERNAFRTCSVWSAYCWRSWTSDLRLPQMFG